MFETAETVGFSGGIFDYQHLFSKNPRMRDGVAAEFVKSLRNDGFAILRNTPYNDGVVEDASRVGQAVFELSLTDAAPYLSFQDYNDPGIKPYGMEMLPDGKPASTRMTYTAYKNQPAGLPKRRGAYLQPGQEKFWIPDELIPGFRKGITRCLDTSDEMGRALLKAVAIGLNLQPDLNLNLPSSFFDPCFVSDTGELINANMLSLNRYLARPDPMRLVPHPDMDLLTLVGASSGEALQVYNPKIRKWVKIPLRPDLVAVLTGGVMDVLTRGLLPLALHRVHATGESVSRPRVSINALLNPSDLHPLPIIPGDGVSALVAEDPTLIRATGLETALALWDKYEGGNLAFNRVYSRLSGV